MCKTSNPSVGRTHLARANVPVIAAVLVLWGGLCQASALGPLRGRPADHFDNLGPHLTDLSSVSGGTPRFNDARIAGAIQRRLVLTNVPPAAASGDSVAGTQATGFVKSGAAKLSADAPFTLITAGPIPKDNGLAFGAAWGDYDNDGFPDLFVGNAAGPTGFLYRNRGDGTFDRVLTNVVGGLSFGIGAWGDYDNDGYPDLYTVSTGNDGVHLYHNQGNGTFLRLTNAAAIGPILTDHYFAGGLAWGDFDNDGFVDMMVANGEGVANFKNFLFHNQGNGSFAKVTVGGIVNDLRESWTVAWADYDDDGRLDLFVTNDNGQNNQLFHNDGPAGFTELTAVQVGSIVHEGGNSAGCAWGDYDNDGFLDLFVAHSPRNLLYHNNGDGTFNKITNGIVAIASGTQSIGCAWVDYDNDGLLDLFVVNSGGVNNYLYHNSGGGTFTNINSGPLIKDSGEGSIDCAWADYDNDGFMDVFISGGVHRNSLLHNDGNSNNWINLKLVGTVSNRAAVGAKVRLGATIGGKQVWQRRDIGAAGSMEGQSELRASFGLGDATNIDTVRIEWPSGTVQEFHNVGSKQFLIVTEPASLKGGVTDAQYQMVLNGGVGFAYDVQASTNLIAWASFTNLVTTNMATPVMPPDAGQAPQQFFRAVRQ